MLRVSRLTDYGIVLLGYLARQSPDDVANTRYLAERAGLPAGTVAKVLKALARQGVVVSQRGAQGGYSLSKPPREISMAQVYLALEGPLLVTQGGVPNSADCSIGSNWTVLTRAVTVALEGVSLWDMTVVQRLHDDNE